MQYPQRNITYFTFTLLASFSSLFWFYSTLLLWEVSPLSSTPESPLWIWMNSSWFCENKLFILWCRSVVNGTHSWLLFAQTCTHNTHVHAWVCVCLCMWSVFMCMCLLHSVCRCKPANSAWPSKYYASKHIQDSSIINNCFDSADGIYSGPQTYIMHNAVVWKCSRTSLSLLIKDMCFSCSAQWQTAGSFYTQIIYRHINNVWSVTPLLRHAWPPDTLCATATA